jgi:hypothetical protein
MKILPVGEELFYVKRRGQNRKEGRMDKQADITKLIVTFRNFANAPKIENCVLNGEERQENRISLP